MTKGGWEIAKKDGYCTAQFFYEDETELYFALDWRTDIISMFLFNNRWKSLQSRNDETLSLDLRLDGNVEDDHWYSKSAKIIGNKEDNISGISAHWDKEYRMDFLVSWSLANGFSATADDIKLGSFTLSGSKDAMLRLVRCAAQGLKNDQSDPFAQ